MEKEKSAGKLYIIATPIGNLEDITYRAVRILTEEVDRVYCEDTRVSRKLLNHYGISKDTYPFHSHSSDKSAENIINECKNGLNIAYISDCGTPGISDPGSRIADAAHISGIEIIPVPGASALPVIVSVAGFPGKNVVFTGFLTKKPGKRLNELKKLKAVKATIVIYESPYRIEKTLAAISEQFPDTNVVIGRELTKMYEEIMRFNTTDTEKILKSLTVKGEFCIAIDNN
ncbi:MAG: 16S rRNA (cytidine(1402)-2'-O)-methyltransferase [Spirochaetes bacterium]|nr:16S rRNA (cytidine(1402)-2'-O)-methyltransferase [Spirochaetota bacterium]